MTNIEILKQIEEDIGYKNDIQQTADYNKLEKGWEKWDIGENIGWCYSDEAKWYKNEFKSEIKENGGFDKWLRNCLGLPYEGILFTLPDERFDISENAIICSYKFPIEKDYCTADWFSLARLLSNKELYKVYKL